MVAFLAPRVGGPRYHGHDTREGARSIPVTWSRFPLVLGAGVSMALGVPSWTALAASMRGVTAVGMESWADVGGLVESCFPRAAAVSRVALL
jgi:hypothetical protein